MDNKNSGEQPMLPKVKEQEHYRKENNKKSNDPSYEIQPFIPTPKKVKRGRPSKAALKEAKSIRGRPKETEGRIAEFKNRLLATSGTFVIDKIVQIALDDKHPNQVAALKMCIDRVLPVSLFEKEANNSKSIQINIINTSDQPSEIDINTIEYEDVSDNGSSGVVEPNESNKTDEDR
jgi:hypothetical protein